MQQALTKDVNKCPRESETKMNQLSYGVLKKLKNTSFQEAKSKVKTALKSEGFGVLTEIDVKEIMKKKLNLDFRNYVILGACNPSLAHKALQADSHLGLLLPCNVVVQETTNGAVEVSFADPKAMFTLVEAPEATPVAQEAEQRLRHAFSVI